MTAAFRPDIQGLRAIAVLAVVLDHAGLPFVGGGYVGVDVFFVVSGFLISGQLQERLVSTGRIGFADFFARRARRILPAALVVILLSVAGALIWMPPLLLPQTLADAVASALYVPNYAQAAQGTEYLTVVTPSLFQHFWSLGVEEQFYLVWPALLAAVWAISARSSTDRSRILLPLVMLMVVVGSLAVCVIETSRDQPWGFFPLWTRAWELAAGALTAAVLARRGRGVPPLAGAIASWLGLAAIVFAAVTYSSGTRFPGFAAALPVAGAVLVLAGGSTRSGAGAVLLLGRRPVQFVGRISYSLYLVHWPILILVAAAAGPYVDLTLWQTVVLAALSIPVAWLLHRLVEEPGRRAPILVRARPGLTLLAVGGSTAVVAAVAVLALVATSMQPLDGGRAVAATAPTAPPSSPSIVPSNLEPSLRTAADDNARLYSDGCQVGYTPSIPHPCWFGRGGQTIVLFGDSHAAQWFPALQGVATSGGFRLETQTKSACPSADVELLWGGRPYARCDRWRAAVIDQLRSDPPDLVVLANYSDPEYADRTDRNGQWERGLQSTIAQLSQFTKVAVIAGTPDLHHDPVVCLSAHLTSPEACSLPVDAALNAPGRVAEGRAASATGAELIDLTGYFCTDECPAIIGRTLVYRDSHHLTATFSAHLAGVLGARITPMLSS